MVVAGSAIAAATVYWANYEKWVTIPAAQALIAGQLRDPDSTQFRNSRITKDGWLCGELNSRNGNGGYVGFKKFVSGGKDNTYYLEGHGVLGERTHEQFIEFMDEQIAVLKIINQRLSQDPSWEQPSKSDQEDMANAQAFEKKWQAMCT